MTNRQSTLLGKALYIILNGSEFTKVKVPEKCHTNNVCTRRFSTLASVQWQDISVWGKCERDALSHVVVGLFLDNLEFSRLAVLFSLATNINLRKGLELTFLHHLYL